jgi:hypothetical protein
MSAQRASRSESVVKTTMENHQGEIFYLYKVQNKTLDDVIDILKRDRGLDVSYVV